MKNKYYHSLTISCSVLLSHKLMTETFIYSVEKNLP